MSIAGAVTGIATGNVSTIVSSVVNMKATKSNVVQRFIMAENGQNLPGSAIQGYAAATAIVDQTYSHAYLENIPDKADWVAIYQQLLQQATPQLRAYMNTKSGAGKTATATSGGPPAAAATLPTTTGGVSLAWLGVILLAAGAGVYFFLKRRR